MGSELSRVAPDLLSLGVLVIAFAGWITIHVALAYRLGRLGPPWRGLCAFLMPPLAPFWGFGSNLRLLPTLWLTLAGAYAIALVIAVA